MLYEKVSRESAFWSESRFSSLLPSARKVRTCSMCQNGERFKETQLHCVGIWLHALRYEVCTYKGFSRGCCRALLRGDGGVGATAPPNGTMILCGWSTLRGNSPILNGIGPAVAFALPSTSMHRFVGVCGAYVAAVPSLLRPRTVPYASTKRSAAVKGAGLGFRNRDTVLGILVTFHGTLGLRFVKERRRRLSDSRVAW